MGNQAEGFAISGDEDLNGDGARGGLTELVASDPTVGGADRLTVADAGGLGGLVVGLAGKSGQAMVASPVTCSVMVGSNVAGPVNGNVRTSS